MSYLSLPFLMPWGARKPAHPIYPNGDLVEAWLAGAWQT